jgi:hypothetical protein
MAGNGFFTNIAHLGDFHNRRASSWDRSGGNRDWVVIPPGETLALLSEKGAGCIRHFYWTYIEACETTRLNIFRGLVLRAFWDGEKLPSLEAPLGDFFGVSNGLVRPVRSLMFCTNPGSGKEQCASWGFNCYLPMPFSQGARIEIENQGAVDARIWFHIDYELYEAASALDQEAGRLHAQWRRENPTLAVMLLEGQEEIKNLSGEENYVILEAQGDGQFVGYFMTVVNHERAWWGEGDDMVFIDGEAFPPSIHGTGTEEIFGGGACPNEEYSGPYTGFHCIENRMGYPNWGTSGMYRFYLADPIRFHKSIRVTIEHGHGNDKANDYASLAFWYQREVNQHPIPLPSLERRQVSFG